MKIDEVFNISPEEQIKHLETYLEMYTHLLVLKNTGNLNVNINQTFNQYMFRCLLSKSGWMRTLSAPPRKHDFLNFFETCTPEGTDSILVHGTKRACANLHEKVLSNVKYPQEFYHKHLTINLVEEPRLKDETPIPNTFDILSDYRYVITDMDRNFLGLIEMFTP